MAQIHEKDNLLMVQYVTGPQHVWLGVRFSRDQTPTEIVVRSPLGGCSHGTLDQDQIAKAIFAAADEYGLHPERIEYVANDSPNYEIYKHCARLLARYASSRSGLDFTPT